MKKIAALRKRLKELQDSLPEIETKATADNATDEDMAAIDATLAEITMTEKSIDQLSALEVARAKASKPAHAELEDDDEPGHNGGPEVEKTYARPAEKLTPRKQLEWIVGGSVKAFEEYGRANSKNVLKSLEDMGLAQYAKELGAMQQPIIKNVNTLAGPAGGFAVPTDLSRELIPLLYRQATFANSGARYTPMPNGNFERTGMATGATAGYRGEGSPGPYSKATFRKIDMKAKLLYGITSLTDQMRSWSFGDAMSWLTNDLETQTSLVYDLNCYVGPGTANTPLGIFNLAGITVVPTAGVFSVAAAPTERELDTLGRRMEAVQDNVNMNSDGSKWVMASRTFNYMKDMRLPNSDELAYPEMRTANPTWRSKPVIKTNAVPVNLGGGTNESFIGLANFGTVLDGRSRALTIKTSDVASFNDGTTIINAFADGSTLIKAEMEHDVEAEYVQSVVRSGPITFGS